MGGGNIDLSKVTEQAGEVGSLTVILKEYSFPHTFYFPAVVSFLVHLLLLATKSLSQVFL